MNTNAVHSQQNGSGNDSDDADDHEKEVIVIAHRLPSGGGGGGGGMPAIIVNVGGINSPSNGLVEFLRGLTTDVTYFDLDPSFTPKQREIIFKAILGLADHPDFADKMTDMLEKGADINFVADFSKRFTGSDYAVISGRNDDGTVDRGESITIYINMNYGGAATTDASFANTVVHELLHTLGDPSLDTLLDAPGSTFDRGPTRDIFSAYNFQAPAGNGAMQANVISVPNGGGVLTGAGDYAVHNGSDFTDRITPGHAGGLIYSGGGDDHIVLLPGAAMIELADGGGNDTIELAAGSSLADVSLRWSSDGSNLSLLVAGINQLTVLNASGGGAVENIVIGGVNYDLASLPQATNHAPTANEYQAKVEGSFFGGYVGDGSSSDLDGDRLTYKLETVSGELAEAMWSVDPRSGAVFGDFTRVAEAGSAYSFVTISASDGIETATSTLTIWWGNRNELPTPIDAVPQFSGSDAQTMPTFLQSDTMTLSGDAGMFDV